MLNWHWKNLRWKWSNFWPMVRLNIQVPKDGTCQNQQRKNFWLVRWRLLYLWPKLENPLGFNGNSRQNDHRERKSHTSKHTSVWNNLTLYRFKIPRNREHFFAHSCQVYRSQQIFKVRNTKMRVGNFYLGLYCEKWFKPSLPHHPGQSFWNLSRIASHLGKENHDWDVLLHAGARNVDWGEKRGFHGERIDQKSWGLHPSRPEIQRVRSDWSILFQRIQMLQHSDKRTSNETVKNGGKVKKYKVN